MLVKWNQNQIKLLPQNSAFIFCYFCSNIYCHNWPTKLKTKMTLLSIEDWVQLLKNCGLKDVISYKTNSTDSFKGTLILYAKKPD